MNRFGRISSAWLAGGIVAFSSAAAALLVVGCASGLLGARPEAQDPSYDDGGDASKVVPVTFDLSDDDLSICTVLVEFWTDANGEWRPATLVPGPGYSVTGAGTATGFHPGRALSGFTVLWDSWTDEVGKVLDGEDVDVRVTPSDIDGTGTSGVSDPLFPFRVDNYLARMGIVAPGFVQFFHGYRNAANPADGDFTIEDTGPVALDWVIADISYPGGETPWIVAPVAVSTSGTATDVTTAPNNTSVVTVSVDPNTALLVPGVYTAIITVDDTNVPSAYDSPQEVQVTITVSRPVMRVVPTSVAFQEGVFDVSSPPDESFDIYNDGPAYTELQWTIDTAGFPVPAWLSVVGASSGTVNGGAAPATVQLAANHAPGAPATPLPAGTYPHTVTVDDSAGAGVPSRDVGVTFPVRPQRPSIFIHDGGGTAFPSDVIDISCVQGLTGAGSFSIRNDGEPASLLDWTLSEGEAWLTCTPTSSLLSGPLAAAVSGSVTADVDAAALTADPGSEWDYETVITVSGSDLSTGEPAAGGDKTLTVHLNVLQPGQIDLSPASVVFLDATWNDSYPTGSPETVTLTNSGEVALNWSGAWVGVVNWIDVTGTQSGTVAIGEIDSDLLTFTVNANASLLGIGDKTATYRYTNADTGQTRDLTLTLHVNYRDLVVQSMTHSPSTPTPGQLVTFTVTVRNQGDAAAGAFTLAFWPSLFSAPVIGTALPQTWTFASGLAAGASTSHGFTYIPPTSSTRVAWGFVDRGAGVTPGDVLEYYETNNAGPSGGHSWVTSTGGPTGDSYEPDDSFGTANTITNGFAQTHSIHTGTDYDYVTFYVSGPTTITARTAGVTGDTVMYLYDPSWTEIGYNDDHPPYTDLWSEIILPVSTSGWYYVAVRSFSTGTIASYTITVTW